MKFFHLSDLHIGRQLHYYPLREDQEAILSEIADYAEKLRPDAIVIAGDIYDKSVPSAEAVAVFDGFLRRICGTGAEILVVSGNHDSPERLEFAGFLLEKQHLHIAGLPPMREGDHIKKVILEDDFGKVCFWLLPFLKPSFVRGLVGGESGDSCTEAVRSLLEREVWEPDMRHVLVTHQFYTSSGQEPVRSDSESVFVGRAGNVDVSAVEGFSYVAMGHLHRAQSVGGERFRYCGTPLKYSVSESGDVKSLTAVTLGAPGEPAVLETLPLHPLRDVKQLKGTLEELLGQGCGDYVSLTLTEERIPYQPREQLERVFPNILELRLENDRIRRELGAMPEAELLPDPAELFGKFYEEIHGHPMEPSEEQLVRELTEKIQEERT